MSSRTPRGKKTKSKKERQVNHAPLSKVWKEADYNDMHELLKTYYEVSTKDDAKELVAEEMGIPFEELSLQLRSEIQYTEWTPEEDAFLYTCSCDESLNEARIEFAVAGKYPHRSTAAVARRKKDLIPIIERIRVLYKPGINPVGLPLIEQRTEYDDTDKDVGDEEFKWSVAEDKVVINGRKNGEDWKTIEKKLLDKDGDMAKKRQKALKKGAAAVAVLEIQKKKLLKQRALKVLQYS